MIVEQFIFTVVSLAIFVYMFFKMIKNNDTSYIVGLILEAVGIALNFLAFALFMELNIFLAYKENDKTKKLQPISRSSYEFKRGYDTQGTKRYKVNYQVNCYFCL